MPKTNDPEVVQQLVPNLPHRLRELRQEMGWSLLDVVKITGVTQRGVVSNWEATNQRRRTPPISTMLVLQRWYGVSLDYLVGHPGAERDSPAVKEGKRLLRERLPNLQALKTGDPSDLARAVLRAAMEVAPDAFFLERVAALLGADNEELSSLLNEGVWADPMIMKLGEVLGIRAEWFYAPGPVEAVSIQA
jgi:transcriptional regulator with XRE-family HTH domain